MARYLTGPSSLLFIKLILADATAKPLENIKQKIVELVPIVMREDFEDEILNGKAGFLAGLLMIRLVF